MEDSINKISPPTLVQAKPVTTPATSLFSYFVLPRPAPRIANKSSFLILLSKVSSIAICLARLRTNFAIILLKERTPDSLVYSITNFSKTLLSMEISFFEIPCSSICFGNKCLLAISIFSSIVYPFTSIISIRSRKGPCTSARLFAVATNITRDRSNSVST